MLRDSRFEGRRKVSVWGVCECACRRDVAARGRVAECCRVSGGWPSAGLLQAWCQVPRGRRQQHLVAHFRPHVCNRLHLHVSPVTLVWKDQAWWWVKLWLHWPWHITTHDDFISWILTWAWFRTQFHIHHWRKFRVKPINYDCNDSIC